MTSFLPVSEVRGDDGCAVYQSLQGTYAGAAGQDFTYIATESDSGKTGLTMKGYLTEFIKEAQVPVLEVHMA